MKRIILFFAALAIFSSAFPQDFFHSDFNHRKKYVVLANPTVWNIKTVQYLIKHGLLDVNTRKTKFVGVYFAGQAYDFADTKKYIEENDLRDFHLHQIHGELAEDNLFGDNACTEEMKLVFDNSVGIFFFGGPDIPPGVYGETNSLSVVTDPNRHFFEASFFFHLLGGSQNPDFVPWLNQNPNYLATGFCLAMQTMNVATGGTLIQDIPAEVYGAKTPEAILKTGRQNLHRNYWQELVDDSLLMGINLHTIKFTDNRFFGTTVKVPKRWEPHVYSSHHQAAEKLGENMEITALSPDGKIVEGLVHSQFPNVFAVQFHPEVPGLYEDMYVRKFKPEDQAMSYNDMIGKKSVKFHKKYWAHISAILRKAKP